MTDFVFWSYQRTSRRAVPGLEKSLSMGFAWNGSETMTSAPENTRLRAVSEELALLVDAVQDYAIFLLSPEGVIRSWNRGAGRILGYSESEVAGRHFSMFYGPDDTVRKKPH